ncbi:unnamed protein product [Leptidea sinapis]|uniref:Uncharacterized protein n=1 Tax=Leptidea sinapis TaxID=189913 RepID=A0A5E4QR22_9NEOP|nr:unnamed protein product [Leptidea sinapis]
MRQLSNVRINNFPLIRFRKRSNKLHCIGHENGHPLVLGSRLNVIFNGCWFVVTTSKQAEPNARETLRQAK